MTHPLLVWLEERIAEQARIAVERGCDTWHTSACASDWRHGFYGDCTCAVKDHVLALVEVHRLILFYHSGAHECSGPDDNCMWIVDEEACPTVRALASAYRHHAGYDPSWAPT